MNDWMRKQIVDLVARADERALSIIWHFVTHLLKEYL